jgi:hypothetical protein
MAIDLDAFGERPLLVGGGSGVPPLYALAKALRALGKRPVAALGFSAPEEVFMAEDFSRLCETRVAVGGYVTDALHGLDCDYVAACGPEPMLKAVYRALDLPGQFSFEARMACGVGACMGCTCVTKLGPKRVCADGPVFRREEILWTPRVSLSGWTLSNPVIAASGAFGYGKEFHRYYDINCLGSFSFKGTTLEARIGNPLPRIAECPSECSTRWASESGRGARAIPRAAGASNLLS